jgi:hypothetical protein
MTSDTTGLDQFHAALGSYMVWTKKSQGAAIEDRAKKVRYSLYKEFRAISRSASSLRTELQGKGFAIKRRTDPEAALAAASAGGTAPVISVEDEIKARIRSLRYLSVSWLFPGWRGAAKGQSARFVSRNRSKQQIGSALLKTAEGTESPYVGLTSFLEGVVAQDSQRRLADRALRSQAADMQAYIARKHQEKLAALFREPFAATISA